MTTMLENKSSEAKGNTSVIIYVNAFDEISAKAFFDELRKAQDVEQKIVPVFIDSYGGDADAVTAMLDAILSFPGKIATVAVGKAMSCGAILLACGEKGMRYAAPCSRIMVHQVSGYAGGKLVDMEIGVAEHKRLNNQIYHLVAKRCGHSVDYFLDLIKEHGNTDIYMTPDDAKKHRIIDHIKYPLVKSEVITKITIS